ncbi:MAG: hypothetical protein P1Q69_11805 [Candidatus Thorarchaeota archaeon]|nr:hypothetical protein [Candidatus Thorarchaeota archaeon]
MTSVDEPQELGEIEERVLELRTKFDTFEYCSEEFWRVYDELVILLLRGAQIATREGDSKRKCKFSDMIDDVENKIPSGYWM